MEAGATVVAADWVGNVSLFYMHCLLICSHSFLTTISIWCDSCGPWIVRNRFQPLIRILSIVSLQTNFRIHVLETLTNLMRDLPARFEDSYCSITVVNHRLIKLIRLVAKNYTHPRRSFTNRFYFGLDAKKISRSGNSDKITRLWTVATKGQWAMWTEPYGHELK